MTAIKMFTPLCKFLLLGEMVHALAGTEPSAIQQDSGLMSANVGDTMVLQCLYKGDMAMHFSWYKQPFREKPHLISTIYKYDKYATFYHEFKDNPRFSVQSSNGVNHLSISDIKSSDAATYYCGSAHSNVVEFGKGTILNVKGSESNSMSVLQQSVSESVQLGDSVTLNCTIHTETCAGGHSVYWFGHGSGESHPGIIYTHGDKSDQCEKSSEAGSPTQTCVYNHPKRNLSLSDDGTYYCAVASCGEILFGDGTKLDIHGGDIQVATEVDMRILVLLSIIRTGVLLCCLTIIFFIYLIRK
uniref:immunoglobulin alpha-2 heavy chain-like n=1 Tax=Oncorhynchus gorbuscha TaxID=8017 RepID=UPI001EAF7ED7|nr:immunoglobulin alpha-2 heavy chain-like [Oncorhynchus gorbuscha]